MDKAELLHKVSTTTHTKEQLIGWIKTLSPEYGPTYTRKPALTKIGDVFMHPIFKHPYVILEKKNNVWLCGLLTSDSEYEQILEQCDSRFYSESFFTKTLFTISEPIGVFINVYDNPKHIKSVIAKLKEIFK